MKRYLILLLLLVAAMTSLAVPPRLASEAVFQRKDLRRPGVDLCIKKQPDNYYRGIIVKKDPKLLEEVKRLMEKDRNRASEVIERNPEEGGGLVLLIPSNGHTINMGLSWKENGDFGFFIQSVMAAFE